MSEIRVTFSALETARADVAGTAARMQSRLEELKRFLAPLVATWEGAAASEYQARQRQWDAAAADLNRVLTDIGVQLGHANDSYRQAERSNAALWA